ncbi:MAG: energy transducer TonB [Cellvibrionales bacterium]|nr:energy transducer TonB [Cellvibrionales bacterium]
MNPMNRHSPPNRPATQRGYLLLAQSAVAALFVVFGLLLLMQFLISADFKEPEDADRIRIADIWQEEAEIEDNIKERKVEEIDDPDEPPPDVPQQDIELDTDIETIDISGGATAKVDITLGAGLSDGDIIPLVAIQPDYPRRALERGIEGYVVVSFIITTQGTTRNIQVVESTSSMFERSAMRAASRLKYKPRVIDGTPVEVEHFYKFTFELADG